MGRVLSDKNYSFCLVIKGYYGKTSARDLYEGWCQAMNTFHNEMHTKFILEYEDVL